MGGLELLDQTGINANEYYTGDAWASESGSELAADARIDCAATELEKGHRNGDAFVAADGFVEEIDCVEEEPGAGMDVLADAGVHGSLIKTIFVLFRDR